MSADDMMMTENRTVRVLVADDDFDMRLLVRATIGSEDHIEVVAEAVDGTQAVAAFKATAPDVCVLDYRMPGLSGLEAAEQILLERPGTRILLFSAYLTAEVTRAAEALGVRCLRKDAFMELPAEIHALASGA